MDWTAGGAGPHLPGRLGDRRRRPGRHLACVTPACCRPAPPRSKAVSGWLDPASMDYAEFPGKITAIKVDDFTTTPLTQTK